MSPKQKKLAAKAPPPNKLDEKDFKVLREEKAKGRGMGLQDESVQPGKVMKAKRGKLGEAKDYKKYLQGLKKATSEVRGAKLNSPAYNITTYDQKSYERAGGKGKAVFKDYKGLGIKNEDQYFKQKKKYSSMEAMRKAKGFKPGESASEFNKRRMKLAGAKKALSATRIGKIVLPIAAAGVAAQQYLKGKMKKDKNQKTLRDFREQKKPGIPSEKTKTINSALNKLNKKMGGGMIGPSQRPGYSKGTMVKARGCKLGRTRPTKIT